MKHLRLTALLLAALPLAACTSPDKTRDVPHAATSDAAEAQMPEVRYYVVADT